MNALLRVFRNAKTLRARPAKVLVSEEHLVEVAADGDFFVGEVLEPGPPTASCFEEEGKDVADRDVDHLPGGRILSLGGQHIFRSVVDAQAIASHQGVLPYREIPFRGQSDSSGAQPPLGGASCARVCATSIIDWHLLKLCEISSGGNNGRTAWETGKAMKTKGPDGSSHVCYPEAISNPSVLLARCLAMSTFIELFREAETLKRANKNEEAISKFQEVLKADESHVLSHMALAVLLGKAGRHADAIRHASGPVNWNRGGIQLYGSQCHFPTGFRTTQDRTFIYKAEEAKAKAHELQVRKQG